MPQRTLHEQLTRLHTELLAARPADPASRDLQQRLAEEIHGVLETSPESPAAEAYRGLRDRLAEAVLTFEGTYPELSTALESLIDTLGQHTL